MPFGAVGMAYEASEGSKAGGERFAEIPFAIAITLKGGLMVTTAAVPGLFGLVFYEYNIPFITDQNDSIKGHHIIGIAVGYGL